MRKADRTDDGLKMRLQARRLRHGGGGPSALRLRQVRAWMRGGRRVKHAALRRVPRLAVPASALQRSVVKVRYAPNRSGGHWRAHGRFHEKASRVNYKFIPNFLLAALADSDFAARLGSPTRLPFALVEGPLPGAGA